MQKHMESEGTHISLIPPFLMSDLNPCSLAYFEPSTSIVSCHYSRSAGQLLQGLQKI